MDYLVVLVAGLFAGTLGGIVGTGSSLVLMPILVVMFGPRQAVPIMAVAAFAGNLGRVLAWRREIDWRACAAYCVTAVPGAMLGARLLLAIPPGVAETALGVFFLALIPARRWLARHAFRLSRTHLMLLGAPLGVLTGVVVSTGPLTVPLFTFYGLERGAFLGTEAASSLGMYAAKAATFRALGALPLELLLHGLAVGATLMAGSFVGRVVVLRLSPASYRSLIDALMAISGVSLAVGRVPLIGSMLSPPALDLVIDTNVVLDWLAFRHPIGTTLEQALRSGRCRWLCTRAMRDELARVVGRGSLGRWTVDAPAVLAIFDTLAVETGAPEPLGAAEHLRCSDPDDQMFVDLAIARRAHALITRDRAVLRLASRARRLGVVIATPEMGLAHLGSP